MRNVRRYVSISLSVFFVVALVSLQAYASGVGGFSFELPPTSQGQGVGNDAAGQKIEGDVVIDWSNYDPITKTADARVLAELSHGNDTQTFTGEIVGFDVLSFVDDPTHIKDVIATSIVDSNGFTVLEYFFGDTTLEVTLKSVDLEYTETFSDGSNIAFAHIIAAVQ